MAVLPFRVSLAVVVQTVSGVLVKLRDDGHVKAFPIFLSHCARCACSRLSVSRGALSLRTTQLLSRAVGDTVLVANLSALPMATTLSCKVEGASSSDISCGNIPFRCVFFGCAKSGPRAPQPRGSLKTGGLAGGVTGVLPMILAGSLVDTAFVVTTQQFGNHFSRHRVREVAASF